jgi:glutathione S-transferase
VPVLQFDDGEVLTENVAILSVIADKHPSLIPAGQFGRYRLLEMLAYISTELHKSFAPLFNPDTTSGEKAEAGEKIEKKLEFVSTRLRGPYLFGENVTVADAYLFVMLMWATKNGLRVPDTLMAFSQTMKARLAVRLALEHEGLL